jgi:hypothetical protein
LNVAGIASQSGEDVREMLCGALDARGGLIAVTMGLTLNWKFGQEVSIFKDRTDIKRSQEGTIVRTMYVRKLYAKIQTISLFPGFTSAERRAAAHAQKADSACQWTHWV